MWITVDRFCDKITNKRLFVDNLLNFMQKRVYKAENIRVLKKFSTEKGLQKGVKVSALLKLSTEKPLFSPL